ncbi:MAG: endonuclease V [Kofleriaceae bacterium]|nr:endonuclease V [Kofleriaceae bacterium]
MIVAVDVDYRDASVVAAAVGFDAWTDADSAIEVIVTSDAPPAAYEPGAFYRRELPHVHAVLSLLVPPLGAIVVDGYVWLAGDAASESPRPGLGAHLYRALGEAVPVIGVAKTAFAGATAIEVVRGASAKPLYVTSAGIEPQVAAEAVRTMHGEHRIPTLLKRVDQLARA